MSVFVDASAFFALLNRRDRFYQEAVEISKLLAEREEVLFTSNYTLAETYTVLRSKMGVAIASRFAQEMSAGSIRVLWVDEEIHGRGLEIFLFRDEPDDLSFFDCVDLAVMERFAIDRAFSFDSHFGILGIPLVRLT